jgi:cytochrome c-type biogenesis protein CcmE
MVKTKNAILASVIIMVCVSAFLVLLASSSVPIFSVKELMDHPNYESYVNRKIQLVGVVQQIDSDGFLITDPEDKNNASLIVFINSTNVEKPTGFESGKTVLVEGKLLSTRNIWRFKASLISTKCPSKYQS